MFRTFARAWSRRPAPVPRRRSTSLRLESLEDRLTPSTTTAGFNNQHGLVVSADVNVTIAETSTPGQYTVTAMDLNSNNPVTFSGVKAIQVTTSASKVDFLGNSFQGTTLPQSVNVTGTGAQLTVNIGAPYIGSFNVQGGVSVGLATSDTSGALIVNVSGPNTTFGGLTVNGRNGGTGVYLGAGVTITGAVTLNLGNADATSGLANYVVTSDPFIFGAIPTGTTINGNFTINGGSGVDSVSLLDDTYVKGNLTANLGGGYNAFASLGAFILSTDLITVGGNLSVNSSGSLSAHDYFTGQQGVEIDGTNVKGNLTINGAQDTYTDYVDVGGFYGLDEIGGLLNISTGAGADYVAVVGTQVLGSGGRYNQTDSINTGAGNDQVFIADSDFQAAFNFQLGSGNNELLIETPYVTGYLFSFYDYGYDQKGTVFLGPVTVSATGTGDNEVVLGNPSSPYDQVQFNSTASFTGNSGGTATNTLVELNVAFSSLPKIVGFATP